MSKKSVFAILSIGIVIIIILASIMIKKNFDIADKVSIKINHALSNLQNANIKPFTCSGFMDISCKSEAINFELDKNVILQDISLNLSNMKKNSLQANINIANITLDSKPSAIQDYLNNLYPNSINCQVQIDKENDKLSEKITCNIKSNAANYEVKEDSFIQNDEFKNIDLISTLQIAYGNLLNSDLILAPTPNKFYLNSLDINATNVSLNDQLSGILGIDKDSKLDEAFKPLAQNLLRFITNNAAQESENTQKLAQFLSGEKKKLNLKIYANTKNLPELANFLTQFDNAYKLELVPKD